MKKFRNLLNESYTNKSFIRKRLGINYSKKELDAFFKTIEGNVYRNFGAFLTDFNEYFDINLKGFTNEEKEMVSDYADKRGRSFAIKSIKSDGSDTSDEIKVSARKDRDFDELDKGKLKKLKIPQGNSDKFQEFAKRVIANMLGNYSTGLMLAGDPGTGKTNAIQTLMGMLNLPLITIEAPHVSEEHIISIPYLQKIGDKVTSGEMNLEKIGSKFEVVNAESNLISALNSKKMIPEKYHKEFMRKRKLLVPIYKDLEKAIGIIHQKVNGTPRIANVLFIDEFYRTGDVRIQNLLREILEGKLGGTEIPKSTYIIYASNFDNSDGSLDEIHLNQMFEKVEFDKPSKDEFMKYMADRFSTIDVETGEDHHSNTSSATPLSAEVYNAFIDNLQDGELGGKDMSTEAEIRISPRRWEEIIKGVNALLPVANETEAAKVLTFLRDNMTDYETKEVSVLYDKYEEIIKDLIKETSGIDASEVEPIENDNWRENLDGQLLMKLKLGEDRKYIPVISGEPGIGKTAILKQLSNKFGLEPIFINTANLNSDDVIGLTAPNTDSNKKLTTEFTVPPLYRRIMEQYTPNLPKPESSKFYTHILLMDELTRADNEVFNGIRALLLDKKVGSSPLPKDILIIAAMNPTGGGTNPLSAHMKDVIDVVPAEGNLDKSIEFFKSFQIYKEGNKRFKYPISDMVTDLFKRTQTTFQSDESPDGETLSYNQKTSYWTDNLNVAYVAPREVEKLIISTIEDILNRLELFDDIKSPEDITLEMVDDITDTIKKIIKEKFMSITDFILEKQGLTGEGTDFLQKFEQYIDVALIDMGTDLIDGFSSVIPKNMVTMEDFFRRTTVKELLNDPYIITEMEKTIAYDPDAAKLDIDSKLISITHTENPEEIINDLGDLYILLNKIDWTQFNSAITSGVSDTIVYSVMQPLIRKMHADIMEKRNKGNKPVLFKDTIGKYSRVKDGTLDSMLKLAEKYKNNMFI